MSEPLDPHVDAAIKAGDAAQQPQIDSANKKADVATGWAAFIKTPLGIAFSTFAIALLGAMTVFFVKYAQNGVASLPTLEVNATITNWPKAAEKSATAKAVKLVVRFTPETAGKLSMLNSEAVKKAADDAHIVIVLDPPHENGSMYDAGGGARLALPVVVLYGDDAKVITSAALSTEAELVAILRR